MKLDQLIQRDSMGINTDEWSCLMELGPLQGSLPALLVEAYQLKSGSVFLRFEYNALRDHTFIGYRVTRVWTEDGTDFIRTVRMDSWTPAKVIRAGAQIEVEVIINPEDWA